jgi:hypothetical protein
MSTTKCSRVTILWGSCLVILAAGGQLAFAAEAQTTNTLPTKLEAIEAQAGTVIIKGAGQIGSLAVGEVSIAVLTKETTDVSAGLKEYGMAIEAAVNNQQVWKRIIDYDEIDSLIKGLNYISRINYDVTSMPAFVAAYATKSGFRVGAYTSQRRAAIQFFLQDYSTDSGRILITPGQIAQLLLFVEQGKRNLDLLRAPN